MWGKEDYIFFSVIGFLFCVVLVMVSCSITCAIVDDSVHQGGKPLTLSEFNISETVITRDGLGSVISKEEIGFRHDEVVHHFWRYKIYFEKNDASKWYWEKDMVDFSPFKKDGPLLNLEELFKKENRAA